MTQTARKYGWHRESRRWTDQTTGRFVARAQIRRALRVTDAAGDRRLRAIARRVADPSVSLTAWRTTLIAEIRAQHLIATATAHGGWRHVPPSAWLETGRNLRREFRHVDRMTALVASGEINPRSRAFLARVASYGGNARKHYADIERREVERAGGEWEARWVLSASEHCSGCLSEPTKWTGVENVGRIGSHACKQFCKCRVEYRRARAEKIND